jgi:exo-1,4-beta-D-glucosaminidase
MGCLIEAGKLSEGHLFYSDNLRQVDAKQFSVPWIYRHEFTIEPSPGKHFFLQTHGISSRADIFLNGHQIVTKEHQAGSYHGRTYWITDYVRERNSLVVQVYPTDYYRDLAVGWIDWNPWPADNGTGIWRDIEIRQTGDVRLDPLRVITDVGKALEAEPATVTLRTKIHNMARRSLRVKATATVVLESGAGEPIVCTKELTVPPGPDSTMDLTIDAIIPKPRIWWPRQWGKQPLYNATLTVTTNADSDTASDRAFTTFGLRSVHRTLNSFNDTTFWINHRPFQVLAAGYTPNMFLRTSPRDWSRTLAYSAALGLNTIRLEGKLEHPGLYDLADRAGIMLLPGWECCDKWEAWPYNDHQPSDLLRIGKWLDADYWDAKGSMLHEASMMQSHPSVLAFLIGSDFAPDERATRGYVEAFKAVDWQVPVIAAAATGRGYISNELTGPSGMKMDGPYDWVPPTYWWDGRPGADGRQGRLGAAFGFGSELGSGVGTPELSSLQKFLTDREIQDLWRNPNKTLYHMSREGSEFTTRTIYNAALWRRWGAPKSLDDYLIKAQLMDYEATRAQFEAYGAMWNGPRPATGLVYWMLNAAWPSLHWQLYDYYMRPAGAFFGAQMATRIEHVVFDSTTRNVWIINRSLDRSGRRRVEVDVLSKHGEILHTGILRAEAEPNKSIHVGSLDQPVARALEKQDVVFLRLALRDDESGRLLSRNVYWVSKTTDVLNWNRSEWYYTPVSRYADFTALNALSPARVVVTAARDVDADGEFVEVRLEAKTKVPAFFINVRVLDRDGNEVLPVTWSENYVTLWPEEVIVLKARRVADEPWDPKEVTVMGKNVEFQRVKLA